MKLDPRTEIVAGCTTFLTMAYIVFVQPAMLSGKIFGVETGMDFDAVLFATCISSAIATLLMGLYARYPIALAPGMGINAYFVASLLPAIDENGGGEAAWRIGLGVVFVAGVFFLVLTFLGIRQRIIDAVSPSMKNAVAVGIGVFIAFIGLQNAGLVESSPGTLVRLSRSLYSPDLAVFFFGLAVSAALHCRGHRASILIGILAATALALVLRQLLPLESEIVRSSQLARSFAPTSAIVSAPPSPTPTLFKLDIVGVFSASIIPFVIVFLFIDLFDTIGTLIGVSEQAGFIRDNQLPRAGRALTADATGTIVGACLGTSTVTSYIESVAGVEAGGRTWLTAVTVAVLFVLTLFFAPVITMVGSYPAITAPALVLVGAMMMRNARRIDWQDKTEAIPAFLTVVGIPFMFSIGDGLALGFLAYPFVKFVTGRGREVRPTLYVLSFLLLLYFVLVRARL